MPAAARVGDLHACPVPSHVGGPVTAGATTVHIGGVPAGRVGDVAACNGPPDAIVLGDATVLIEFLPAARQGDSTAHGGVIAAGDPTVLIGMTPQAGVLVKAAEEGSPFCEECGKRDD